MFDPLILMLIDDKPFSRTEEGVADLNLGTASPAYRRLLKQAFRLLWLKDADESRQYFNGIRIVGQHSPRRLGEIEVVPEVVVFDYSLTGGGAPVNDEEVIRARESSNPLPRIEDMLEKLGLTHCLGSLLPYHTFGYTPNQDRFGAYAGGQITLELGAHPTVGIPTTQYDSVKETRFYEWFLEAFFLGSFASRSRSNANWDVLLKEALPNWRRSVINKVKQGLIVVSLRDVLNLTEATLDKAMGSTVRYQSRYANRELSVQSMFFDILHWDPTDQDQEPKTEFTHTDYQFTRDDTTGEVRREVAGQMTKPTIKAIQDWAKELLNSLMHGRLRRDDLRLALEVADAYQKAYENFFEERYAISEAIFGCPRRPGFTELPSAIQELMKLWGADKLPLLERGAVITPPSDSGRSTMPTIAQEAKQRSSGTNNDVEPALVARLASLFCIVWAEKRVRDLDMADEDELPDDRSHDFSPPQRMVMSPHLVYDILAPSPAQLSLWWHRGQKEEQQAVVTDVYDLSKPLPPTQVLAKFNGETAIIKVPSELFDRYLRRLKSELSSLPGGPEPQLIRSGNFGRIVVPKTCKVSHLEIRMGNQTYVSTVVDYSKRDFSGDVGNPLARLNSYKLNIDKFLGAKDVSEMLHPGEAHLLWVYANYIEFPLGDLPEWLREQLPL